MKTPFMAFLVFGPRLKGYTDSVSCSVVAVIEIDREGKRAKISKRCGSTQVKEWVPWTDLASTLDAAAEILRARLGGLAGAVDPSATLFDFAASAPKAPLQVAAGQSAVTEAAP